MIAVAIAVSVGAFGAPLPVLTPALVPILVGEFLRIAVLGGPFEEELGWRGFALPRLQSRWSAFRSAVALGVVWGLWHIPLYFISGTGQIETAAGSGAAFAIVAFTVWTTGLSVLFTWLFNQTGGSVLIAMLFHASVNLGAFVPAAVGSAGAATFLYAVVTWVVALIVANRLGEEHLAGRSRVTVGTGRAGVPVSG
jgi:membrane protease YdiL (CAAX protease family)